MLPSALLAHGTIPYTVELVHRLLYDRWVIGKDASFEVTVVLRLHAHTGTSQIGAADICRLAIQDDHLEVYTGTEHPLKSIEEFRILGPKGDCPWRADAAA